MNNIAISIIGRDCPGVVNAIAIAVTKAHCKIVEMTQSLLKGQFTAIVIVSAPDGTGDEDLQRIVSLELDEKGMDLSVSARTFDLGQEFSAGEGTEPFVVTVNGPDASDILLKMTGMFTENKINIENLRALQAEDPQAESSLIFEISLPLSINRNAFRQMVQAKARQNGMQVSIQHQSIFEAIHRVPIV